uniref:Transmembrane protein n=1 Tax=Heterorhabditis bacteriophora TaxID=37862 RepID=A0A1I7XHS5_HETBA
MKMGNGNYSWWDRTVTPIEYRYVAAQRVLFLTPTCVASGLLVHLLFRNRDDIICNTGLFHLVPTCDII